MKWIEELNPLDVLAWVTVVAFSVTVLAVAIAVLRWSVS